MPGDEGSGGSDNTDCGAPFTPIYTIQGSGVATPLDGQTVTTEGMVVGDYEGSSPTLRGFFIQDPTGDGKLETSDGIFVFNSNNDSVNLGDTVRVSGVASEYFEQTQISNVSALTVCNTGQTIAPTTVNLPFASAEIPEQYEGMLVKLPQTLYVTEHYQLGRYGEVVVSAVDRLFVPTHLAAPGSPAALALQAANARNRLIIDDASTQQNPDPIVFGRGGQPLSATNTLRGGDTVQNLIGVMAYSFGAYRVYPLNALGGGIPNFTPANPRPPAIPAVGGSLKVASFNVLNYFLTLDTGVSICGPLQNQECRGADSDQEFTRQRNKLLAALVALDAHIVGLIEVENTLGVEPLADLVAGLNNATAPNTYAFIDTGVIGTDAIKVGLIYQTATVTPVGAYKLLDSSVDGRFLDSKNRPTLAQTFRQVSTGAIFTVAVNHLKSKGSSCDDVGDSEDANGQGNCNGVRTEAAHALADWLATDPTGSGDPDALVLGDLNAYAKEDPVAVLEQVGYVNLAPSRLGPTAYSYVFDGQWGALDHALASPSLVNQVAGVADVHINADEPNVLDYNTDFKSVGQIEALYAPDFYRTSDHDPVLVGLSLASPPAAVPGDVNQDGVVDRTDLNLVTAARNTPASGPDDPRDLDGDGMITV
ncbi:MAG: ExeM/NucH family extracellular endonuclease, partial [Candidatus Competibacteraceae bacterium]|nr:ExeM/NucH family extracellular endonuclease [Candidatus Competibacteraceae bacterium]